MQERIKNILNQVIGRGNPFLKGFQVEDNRSLELKTAWSEYDHRTWLEYELLNDNQMVTIKIAHIFGHLEFKPNMSAEDMSELNKQLLNLLRMNVKSFQTSSAYLGIRYMEPNFFASLHNTLIFLSKWQDEDIFSGELIEMDGLTLKFKVERLWKGEFKDEVSMATGAIRSGDGFLLTSMCDYKFALGRKYLVFAHGSKDKLKASKCSWTGKLGERGRFTDELDRLKLLEAASQEGKAAATVDLFRSGRNLTTH